MEDIVLARIEEALDTKMDTLHRENMELRTTLDNTIRVLREELAKAGNERTENKVRMGDMISQLKAIATELQETREERNALKLELGKTEAKLHNTIGDMHLQLNTQLGEMETQLQTISSNVDASKNAI
jgi:chromosome segregation ATPase